MAIKIYISGSFIIAEDVATRTPYFKERRDRAFHFRSDDDQYSFFYLESVWNVEGNAQPLQLRVPFTLKWDTQQVEPEQRSSFLFADIVDINGLPYANSDDLNTYLNMNLGSLDTITSIATLENQIIVNQDNVATTIGAVIDSTKEYFLDGIIDVGTTEITVPITGITIRGYSFDLSGLITTEDNHTMFKSETPVIGSGNMLIFDFQVDSSGLNSKVFDIYDYNGFNAIEAARINYNNCTSLGDITDYRQGLEDGTGRFGGTPNLTLSGTWAGGYRITTSIVRALSSGMTGALFQEGTAFTFGSRFLTDINVDLPTNASLIDFQSSNFTAPSLCQIQGAIVTRNGVFDANDSNISPNLTESELASSWKNNQGLTNTFVGGTNTITSENLTVIGSGSTFYDLNAIWTASELQHFDTPATNQLRHLGNNPREFKIICDFIIEGQQNNDLTLRITKYDASTASETTIFDQRRQINNLVGGRDVAFFNINTNVTLDQNDYIYMRVANNSGNQNVTAENTSYFTIEER